MPARPFNAKRHFQQVGELLRPIDVESALLFCNHVLMAWRGQPCDPVVRNLVAEIRLPCSPFFVHLAARQILLRSLGHSGRGISPADFKRLFGLLWELLDNDPVMRDPGWRQSDPTGTLTASRIEATLMLWKSRPSRPRSSRVSRPSRRRTMSAASASAACFAGLVSFVVVIASFSFAGPRPALTT